MAAKIYAGIVGLVFGTDMILKQYIEENFRIGEERELAGGRLLLRKVYNRGAALNLLSDRPELVKKLSAGLTWAALVCDALLLRRRGSALRKTGMMLYTGGALSNLYDRLRRGRVIDYIGIRTRWKRLTRITWNLADFAIMTGAALTLASRRKA